MLFAYGAANLAAGFTGSIVTGNSPSRSAAMDASGAKSQLPSLVAAVTIARGAAVLHRHAGVPSQCAALAGIVANAVLSLIEVHELRELWHMRRSDFWIAAVCLLSVLALGPLRAVLIAFLMSTIDVIRRASRPWTSVLVEAADRSHFAPAAVGDAAWPVGPGCLPVRRPALLRQRDPLPRRGGAAHFPAVHAGSLVRARRAGDGRRGHHRRSGSAAGYYPAGRPRHYLRLSAAPTGPSGRGWSDTG